MPFLFEQMLLEIALPLFSDGKRLVAVIFIRVQVLQVEFNAHRSECRKLNIFFLLARRSLRRPRGRLEARSGAYPLVVLLHLHKHSQIAYDPVRVHYKRYQ